MGHAVRALYLAAGVTDIYTETGDEQLLDAMLAQWDDAHDGEDVPHGRRRLAPLGESIGDPHELPPDRAYCETCAAIASIMWNWRMLLVTGQSRFADLIERTLYNGFLSGLSLDGRTFFYVNPLQSRGGHGRHMWDPVACCPPNIMRLLASLDQYLATTSDAGVQLHQYAPATIRATSPSGDPVELRVETDYPWSGSVDIEVVASGSDEWTLVAADPGVGAARRRVDGERVAPGTYARLTRRWRPGDRVALELDVAPRLTAPNPRIDAVRGCLAVERGPLVYCFEERDLPDGVDLADVRLAADPGLADAGPLETLAAMPGVTAEAIVNSLDGWREVDYRDVRELGTPPAATPTRLLAVPYFAWANRSAGAMRVWVPTAGATDLIERAGQPWLPQAARWLSGPWVTWIALPPSAVIA